MFNIFGTQARSRADLQVFFLFALLPMTATAFLFFHAPSGRGFSSFVVLVALFSSVGFVGFSLPLWYFTRSRKGSISSVDAGRGSTTEFAPPAGVEPWEAAAVLGTSDVVTEWFHEMLTAGALTWEVVEEVVISDAEGYSVVLLEVGDLSQVSSADAELIFNVVVPGGRPRPIKMFLEVVVTGSGENRRRSTVLSFGDKGSDRVDSLNFGHTFRLLRGHLQERLSGRGWFTKFRFQTDGNLRKFGKIPMLSYIALFAFFPTLPLLSSDNGDNTSSLGAIPASTAAIYASTCAFLFFLVSGFILSHKEQQLTPDGAWVYQQTDSFRRLLKTAVGDRVLDAKESGFGHEFFPWLRAFGLVKVYDDTVSFRDHTPLRLAAEGSKIGGTHIFPSFPKVYPTVTLQPVPPEFLVAPKLSHDDAARAVLRRQNIAGDAHLPMGEELRAAATAVPSATGDSLPEIVPFKKTSLGRILSLILKLSTVGVFLSSPAAGIGFVSIPDFIPFICFMLVFISGLAFSIASRSHSKKAKAAIAAARPTDSPEEHWRSYARQHPGFQSPDYAAESEEIVAASASWLADPLGRFTYRFWDGQQWTAQVSNGGTAEIDPQGIGPS